MYLPLPTFLKYAKANVRVRWFKTLKLLDYEKLDLKCKQYNVGSHIHFSSLLDCYLPYYFAANSAASWHNTGAANYTLTHAAKSDRFKNIVFSDKKYRKTKPIIVKVTSPYYGSLIVDGCHRLIALAKLQDNQLNSLLRDSPLLVYEIKGQDVIAIFSCDYLRRILQHIPIPWY